MEDFIDSSCIDGYIRAFNNYKILLSNINGLVPYIEELSKKNKEELFREIYIKSCQQTASNCIVYTTLWDLLIGGNEEAKIDAIVNAIWNQKYQSKLNSKGIEKFLNGLGTISNRLNYPSEQFKTAAEILEQEYKIKIKYDVPSNSSKIAWSDKTFFEP